MNNDNFVWTDELVKEFIDFGRRMMVISDIDSIGMNIDKFKQSKSIPNKEDKKPILTTEDGVEYFEGEKKSVYCIGKDNWCIDTHPEYYNQLDDYYSKFFSTKEKALDYCLMNKPNMSIKDVTDIILILSGLLYDKTIVDKIEYNGRLVSAIIDNQKSKLK